MLPDARRAVAALLVMAAVAGCNRVTLLRPDTSRGGYRQIAPEVQIRSDSKRTSALNLTQVAQARLLAGDAAAALTAAQGAVKADGRLADAHSLLGLSLEALGRGHDAGAHHRRAVELAPQHGALLNNYGTWLCSNGQAAEALPLFERAFSSAGYGTPELAVANYGACALRAGDLDRAHGALRRAIELSPENPVALKALAEVELRRGRAFEARAFVERRLAAAPADRETLLLASQIEQRLGDSAAAERYVRRIRAEFPRDPDSAPKGGEP